MTEYRLQHIDSAYWLRRYQMEFNVFAKEVGKCFGNKFNFKNFDIDTYVENPGSRIMVAWKGTEVVGCYLARLTTSIFDSKLVLFNQDLIYVREGNPRAARLLFLDLIDFGKTHANHVITCVTTQTNISERSLEKRGFKKLETSYRLET